MYTLKRKEMISMNTYEEIKKEKLLLLLIDDYEYYVPLVFKNIVQEYEWEIQECFTPIARNNPSISLNNITPYMTYDNGLVYVSFKGCDSAGECDKKLEEFEKEADALKELKRLEQVAKTQPKIRVETGREMHMKRRNDLDKIWGLRH